MGSYHATRTMALSAASATAVAASQTNVGAVNLLINGSAASGGVATFTQARQILFTFAADETGHTYTVTGTNASGQVQSEVVAGSATTAVTLRDYLTVTRIAASATSTGAITVGTNGVAGSVPYIVDRFVAATNMSAAVVITGTVNYSVQISHDDFASSGWDLINNTPTWFAPSNTTNLTAKAANAADVIVLPVTMVRILQNSFSTGGTATLTVNVPMGFVG